MKIFSRVVAAILVVVAALALALGAFGMGIRTGVFDRANVSEMARALSQSRRFQSYVAGETADAALHNVAELRGRRAGVVAAVSRLGQTQDYRSLVTEAIDQAYRRTASGADGSIVLAPDDLVAILAEVPIPKGGLGDQGVVILPTQDVRTAHTARELADRYAILLLALGAVAAVAAMLVPGRPGLRLAALGLILMAASGLLYFGMGLPRYGLVERLPLPSAALAHAAWNAGISTMRLWLGGAAVVGLFALVFGLAIEASRPQRSTVPGDEG